MPTLDRLLLWLGTPLLAMALLYAARETRTASASWTASWAPASSTTPAPAPAALRARLPEGLSIDPDTLELVGFAASGEDGAALLSWGALREYEYREGLAGLPATLQALDGTRVTMAGFLLPLYEFDDIREFHLVASHWSCCFGVPPGITGWVHVQLARGVEGLHNTTEPIQVTGTFRIREQKEAGYIVSIWSIEEATAHVLGW